MTDKLLLLPPRAGRPMNGHPQTITGKMLLGYSLEKNRHMQDWLFSSSDAAKEEAERTVNYPLEWVETVVTPEGHALFRGMHPRMMAQYQAIKLGGFTPATDAESDVLRAELGYGAWWDQYGVEPVTDPIREDIEGAEYIDRGEPGGYYIKPFGRGWAVCTDDTNLVHGAENIFHTLADTRFEALAKAWAMHRADVVKIEKMGRRSQLPPKRFWQFWR